MVTNKKIGLRLSANFLTAFLSPLIGTSISFNLDIEDINIKILLTALISSSIVTGLVLARELDNRGRKK